jgi:transposase
MSILHVGLDAHLESITVAALRPGSIKCEVWQVANEPATIRRMVRKFEKFGADQIRCCYEAGPGGYVLQRQLVSRGIECVVVAPSLIPVKPGDRVKTDRRDAEKLAEYLRKGLLTEVHPPSPEDEAVRDLCRAHDDIRIDLLRARHRMTKFLARRGCRFIAGKKNWTVQHRHWLRALQFEQEADQHTFDDYLLGIEQLEERRASMVAHIDRLASSDRYRLAVEYLSCLKGVSTLTGLSLAAEIHDIRRFPSARALMSYVGLVPSEYSSGRSTQRGAITKAGNQHLRRLLVEAAWHYRHRPRVAGKLRERRQGNPPRVTAIAQRADQRLYRRFLRHQHVGKPAQKITTAIARELVGFVRDLMNEAQANAA